MCGRACVHARARASVCVRAFLCAVRARAWTQVDAAFARAREREHACLGVSAGCLWRLCVMALRNGFRTSFDSRGPACTLSRSPGADMLARASGPASTLAALCARGPGHRGQTCSQTGVSAKEIRARREADLCSIWPQIEQRLEAYVKDPSTRSGDGIELWSLVAAAAAAVTFVPVTQKVPLGLRDHRRCRQAGEKKIMLALRCRSEWIPNP